MHRWQRPRTFAHDFGRAGTFRGSVPKNSGKEICLAAGAVAGLTASEDRSIPPAAHPSLRAARPADESPCPTATLIVANQDLLVVQFADGRNSHRCPAA